MQATSKGKGSQTPGAKFAKKECYPQIAQILTDYEMTRPENGKEKSYLRESALLTVNFLNLRRDFLERIWITHCPEMDSRFRGNEAQEFIFV